VLQKNFHSPLLRVKKLKAYSIYSTCLWIKLNWCEWRSHDPPIVSCSSIAVVLCLEYQISDRFQVCPERLFYSIDSWCQFHQSLCQGQSSSFAFMLFFLVWQKELQVKIYLIMCIYRHNLFTQLVGGIEIEGQRIRDYKKCTSWLNLQQQSISPTFY